MATKTSLAMKDITKSETMELEVIGPELAEKYLALSAPNRQLRPGSVSQYARDMKMDNWHMSVIRFAVDGKLWDGQHRLKAIIESKTEQLFWVERNVPLEAVQDIDTGLKRSFGDVLQIKGEVDSRRLAATIRVASWIEKFPGLTPSTGRTPLSITEQLRYLEENPDLHHSLSIGEKVNRALRFPTGLAAGLHYLEQRRNRPLAQDFWEQIVSGADLEENTGPWALRKIIIEDSLKPLGTRMDMNFQYAAGIKAWNFWEYSKPITRLQWKRGGGEPFPKLGQRP